MFIRILTLLLKTRHHRCFRISGIILVVFLSFTSGILTGQTLYTSKDKYKGNWENSNTWDPVWNNPDTLILGLNVTINGYVTRNGSLEFSGSSNELIIKDTLVIYGNLSIKNNSKLILFNNSVLIVRGNLLLGNTADIYSNSFLVVTGDFIKSGDVTKGSFFTSSPSNVFILGNVPGDLVPSRYPTLKCPSATPYANSGCGYGNLQDLAASSIFSFFRSTCSPVVITSSSSPLCVNDSRTLTATPAGGAFSIVTGSGSLNGNILTATAPGTLVIKYTASTGCTGSGTQNLVVKPLPTALLTITENSGIASNDGIICAGDAATLTATGGVNYVWSSGETTPAITKSSANTYTVTVTDANNCQSSVSTTVAVNSLPSAIINITDNSGTSPNDGIICSGNTVILDASGGTTYSWSTGETSSSITKSISGTYTVTVTDVNNCQNNASTTISVNPLPEVSVAITESSGKLINDGILCSGAAANLTASGGIAYSWSSGETSSFITKSIAGTYIVTATDVNNCKSQGNAMISVNSLPDVLVAVTEKSGKADNDGIICSGDDAVLTASGAISYLWSTGESLSSVIKNSSGTYTVTAIDGNNCQNTGTATIEVKTLTSVSVSVAENSGMLPNDGILCNGESVSIAASGGIAWSWSSGETSQVITTGLPGTYSVTASDENNCQNTAETVITVNPLPNALISLSENSGMKPDDGIICSGESVKLVVSGGETYAWSSGATSPEIIQNVPGTYSVTVTDGNYCKNTASATITVNSLPEAIISVSETSGLLPGDGIICSGTSATLAVSGGTKYLWSTGETTSSVVTGTPGTYTVTVTDGNNCQNKANTEIKVIPLPEVKIQISELSGIFSGDGIICYGDTAILTVLGKDTYQWSTGEKGPQIRVKEEGNYSLTATTGQGCSSSANAVISTVKVIASAGKDTDVCGNQHRLNADSNTGTGKWTIKKGVGSLTFLPDENNPMPLIKTNEYGSYNLTWMVMKENCLATSDINITFHENPVARAGSDQELNYAFQTKLEAETPLSGKGQWSLLSGTGNIFDSDSPTSEVFNLSEGENKFMWTVSSDLCSVTDTVSILVSDLFVPNVITPDGDNKNNFFTIRDIEKNSPVQLTIFNKWGNTVYKNNNYNNTWDGRSDDNALLPDDTYFYILTLANGKVIKSFVVIKR